MRDPKQTRVVVFHREGVFYPLELPVDDDLAAHARMNPGTIKITDALTETVLWPVDQKPKSNK